MELEGKVILDLGMTSGTSKAGNAWKKKEVIVETFGQYPRRVKITLFGDRSDTVKAEVGYSYVFSIDIDSREFNGRWYTDVSAFSSRPLESAPGPAPIGTPGGFNQGYPQPQQQTTIQTTETVTTAPAADPFGSSDSDDLPF